MENKTKLMLSAAVFAGMLFTAGPAASVGAAEVNIDNSSAEAVDPSTGTAVDSAGTSDSQNTSDDDILQTVDPEDIIYDAVEVDPETGLTAVEADAQGITKKISLSSDLTYDPSTATFCQTFGSGDGENVTCTVASGMITNGTVSMTIGSGLSAAVYRDGVLLDSWDPSNITTAGNYAVRLSDTSGEDLGTYGFRLVSNYSNILQYQLPDTFTLESVEKDGYSMWTSGNTVSFEDEGQYYVTYINDETEVEYTLNVYIDHTAPVLTLAAVNQNLAAHSAVDISDLETGATLTVIRDGTKIENYGNKLTTPGQYQLTVQDEAGNITTYAFTLYMYFTLSSALVLALIVLIQFGLIVYMIFSRKKYRVR